MSTDTVRYCLNQYTRPGGRQPGDRIVECGLLGGHSGDHEDPETGAWWNAADDVLDACLVCNGTIRRTGKGYTGWEHEQPRLFLDHDAEPAPADDATPAQVQP